MSKKGADFIKGTQSEKSFRLGVCILGALLLLGLLTDFGELLFSFEEGSDFFEKSAFMVSDVENEPSSFIDEIK